MYSLNQGDLADNYLACPAGTSLSELENEGICNIAPITFGDLPKECSSDDDCISFYTQSTTECVCGINLEGKSYCQLFKGDDAYQNYYKAKKNHNFDAEVY